MTPAIDARFSHLADRRVEANPMRHHLGLPLLRMATHWLNVDGAQTLLRVVELRRPWSTAVVAMVLCMRVTLVVLLLAGLLALATGRRRLRDPMRFKLLACYGAIVVTLRTVELGALSPVLGAGLVEYRYTGIVFPAAILVSIYGAYHLVSSGELS